MEFSSLTSGAKKRNAYEANLEDLEVQMANLTHDNVISQNKDYLSSHAINSYLNPSQISGENEDEQIKLLHRAILEEKSCPNILPFQNELIDNMTEIVDNQDQAIKDAKQTLENKMFLNIYSLELERIKYLLKSYLRIRLFKIQKYATHIIRNKLEVFLSKQEDAFLKQYFELKQGHFKENFLDHLTPTFRNLGLDEKNEKKHSELMVDGPDLDKAVIIRVLRRFERFTLDIESGEDMDLIPGDIYCFKYKDIQNLHEQGFVEFV